MIGYRFFGLWPQREQRLSQHVIIDGTLNVIYTSPYYIQ